MAYLLSIVSKPSRNWESLERIWVSCDVEHLKTGVLQFSGVFAIDSFISFRALLKEEELYCMALKCTFKNGWWLILRYVNITSI